MSSAENQQERLEVRNMLKIEGIEVKHGDVLNTHLDLQTKGNYRFVFDPEGRCIINFFFWHIIITYRSTLL